MLREGVGLDAIVRYNAGRGVYGQGASDDFVAERIASLLDDDEPMRLRLHGPQRVLEVRSARLPDGGIVTTYTDITPDRRLRGGTRGGQRGAGAPGQRAHRGARAPQPGAGARENRGRGGQPLQDALSRRRQPRPPAAAQRRAALCEFAGGDGAGRADRRARATGAQRRRFARGGRGDSGRAARHFPARRRGDAAGDQRRVARRAVSVSWRSSSRRWRAPKA